MNNNHRKRLNLYTQGQRWTVGVLLMVGMLGSWIPGSAFAKFSPIGLVKLGVFGALFGGGSSFKDGPLRRPVEELLDCSSGVDRSLKATKHEVVGDILRTDSYLLIACSYLGVGMTLISHNSHDYQPNPRLDDWAGVYLDAEQATKMIIKADNLLVEFQKDIEPSVPRGSLSFPFIKADYLLDRSYLRKELIKECGDPDNSKGRDYLRFSITLNGADAALAKAYEHLAKAKENLSSLPLAYSNPASTLRYMDKVTAMIKTIRNNLADPELNLREDLVEGTTMLACSDWNETRLLNIACSIPIEIAIPRYPEPPKIC